MKKPQMSGTKLANGFENTSAGPVLTVWTGAYSTCNLPVSSRKKSAERCGVTRNDRVANFSNRLYRRLICLTNK
jgi:hypothetical protein